jgi:uncharacterized membrane protein YeaQ/YmgE (transglycosylase-associated protein family)
MINVVVWVLCGAIVGIAAAWRHGARSPAFLLFIATGTLGSLMGGLFTFIFDTAPLHTVSRVSLLGAIGGAVVLVALARRLSQTAF